MYPRLPGHVSPGECLALGHCQGAFKIDTWLEKRKQGNEEKDTRLEMKRERQQEEKTRLGKKRG